MIDSIEHACGIYCCPVYKTHLQLYAELARLLKVFTHISELANFRAKKGKKRERKKKRVIKIVDRKSSANLLQGII